ncbi:phosphoprotein [Citrus leprosis virus N]|uniref:Phosphoprotein n=1 Tax=Citrus leprosis virus N TaxID=1956177 RepID=A0A1W6AWM3_9RHAB|nr:phosphoprotein [Citrus leprosis virus N]
MMNMIGTSTNMFPEVPESSQIQTDIESYGSDDHVSTFIRKWQAHGITPPMTLSNKIREWIKTKGDNNPIVLDQNAVELGCIIWNACAEHHHLINKSQVTKMSDLVDQLGEHMRGQSIRPDERPPHQSSKRKHEDTCFNPDIDNMIADSWTEKRKGLFAKKTPSQLLEIFSWLLIDYLSVITKTFTESWVTKQDLAGRIGDIAVFCFLNKDTLTDEQKTIIRNRVVDRLSKSKKPCLN